MIKLIVAALALVQVLDCVAGWNIPRSESFRDMDKEYDEKYADEEYDEKYADEEYLSDSPSDLLKVVREPRTYDDPKYIVTRYKWNYRTKSWEKLPSSTGSSRSRSGSRPRQTRVPSRGRSRSNRNRSNNNNKPIAGGKAKQNKGSPRTAAEKACLDKHNEYRKLGGKTPLAWDSSLLPGVQSWANKLLGMGSMMHSQSNGAYGENLAYAMNSRGVNNLGNEAVIRWFDEICDYTGSQCGPSSRGRPAVGHFTQVMWEGSKYMACAIAKSSDGQTVYTVARYTPPGNYRNPGYYEKNVGCANSNLITNLRNKFCNKK